MSQPISVITAGALARDRSRFSEIIDVRSPSEFADDGVADAVNLPVMDDGERERIGTIYKQESRFRARREGAAIIAEHAAAHLRGHFASKPGAYFPLLYCWRGGMRSQSLATILAAVGWRVALVEGGYKAIRGEIVRWFAEDLEATGFRFVVVAGLTGSAKTHILRALAAAGEQVLDLEGHADHRGSLLGAEPGSPQPSQRRFEGRLWETLRHFEAARPVFVESESHRIGSVQVPPAIWRLMRGARVIEIESPAEARCDFLLRTYAHFTADPEALVEKLGYLRRQFGVARIEDWSALARAGEWRTLVGALLGAHYDPAYRRSRGKLFGEAAAVIEADALGEAEIAGLADRVRAAAGVAGGE